MMCTLFYIQNGKLDLLPISKKVKSAYAKSTRTFLDQNKISYEILPEGKFKIKIFKKLYNDLTAKGKVSEIEALKAGATIEDVDIYDLQRLTKETQNQDILDVYKFLECASRNHLRAFSRNLEMRNANYVPQYISKMITKKSSMLNMNNVVCKTACNAKIKEKAEEIEEEEMVLEMEIA